MNKSILYFLLIFLSGPVFVKASQQSTKKPKTTQEKMGVARKKFDQPKRRPNSQKIDWDSIKRAEKENIALKATYKQLEAHVLSIAPKALDSRGVERLKEEFAAQIAQIKEEAQDTSDELVRLQVENDSYNLLNVAMTQIVNDLLAQEQLKSGRITPKDIQEMKKRAQEAQKAAELEDDEDGDDEL